jgi:hypothetical protein
MIYLNNITVPQLTFEDAGFIVPVKLNKGVIRKITLGFPYGCAGLVHVVIYDRGTQILPFTLGQSVAWDGYVAEFIFDYPLKEEPYMLNIHLWNEDDTFQHTIMVAMVLDEKGEDQGTVITPADLYSLGGEL